MDYKLVALLLVLVAVTFEAADASPSLLDRAAFMQLQPGSARAAYKAAEAVHRQKRSADHQAEAVARKCRNQYTHGQQWDDVKEGVVYRCTCTVKGITAQTICVSKGGTG